MIHGLETMKRLNEEAARAVHPEEVEHEILVSELAKDGWEIADSMDGQSGHLLHMILGVFTEVGELGDAIKKHVIYQKILDRQNVIEELGDIEFYLQGIRRSLGISRLDTLRHNINKLRKRYGAKYSNEAAQARADKQDDTPTEPDTSGFFNKDHNED